MGSYSINNHLVIIRDHYFIATPVGVLAMSVIKELPGKYILKTCFVSLSFSDFKLHMTLWIDTMDDWCQCCLEHSMLQESNIMDIGSFYIKSCTKNYLYGLSINQTYLLKNINVKRNYVPAQKMTN